MQRPQRILPLVFPEHSLRVIGAPIVDYDHLHLPQWIGLVTQGFDGFAQAASAVVNGDDKTNPGESFQIAARHTLAPIFPFGCPYPYELSKYSGAVDQHGHQQPDAPKEEEGDQTFSGHLDSQL